MSATITYSAGAQIPITRTFVQGSVTTAIALIGQVLDSGATNWVGVDQGDADYLLTASAANAIETTLANGDTYYFSSGSAPAGYLLLTGPLTTIAGSTSNTAASSTATATTTHSSSSSSGMTTTTSSQTTSASGTATTTSSAQRLSGGAVLSIGLALFATLSMNFLF